MQPASRASIWIEVAIAIAGIGLSALAYNPHRPKRAATELLVVHVELRTPPPIVQSPAAVALDDCDVEMPPPVEQAYRERRFDDASRAARDLPGCGRTSALLQLLDQQWRAGLAHDGDAATHLVALQQARSTDLSLGGAHADELDRAIAAIASRAAELYLARARETGCTDVDAAARALDDAALLGVHDERRAKDVIRERASLHCAATPSLAVDY